LTGRPLQYLLNCKVFVLILLTTTTRDTYLCDVNPLLNDACSVWYWRWCWWRWWRWRWSVVNDRCYDSVCHGVELIDGRRHGRHRLVRAAARRLTSTAALSTWAARPPWPHRPETLLRQNLSEQVLEDTIETQTRDSTVIRLCLS